MSFTVVKDFDKPGQLPPLGPNVKALMVWPKIPPSFWSFQNVMGVIGKKAVMPPLGLITVAALCPPAWSLKLIDLAVEELSDRDIRWADLVMVSAMHVQRHSVNEVLQRARELGKRTIIGGPFASSQPYLFFELADHVVVGEPDQVFGQIARELEDGSAKSLYEIIEKPDVTQSPIPRFDLLKIEKYASMPVQFSRGCPFQCDFCDIITIYGRRPRTKDPEQIVTELETLFSMGWRKEIFIVDDNFIGNRKRALALVTRIESWQEGREYPFTFYTEASLDLAQYPELIEAMVKANFFYVFIGIESPSADSLTASKKFQNLRQNLLHAVRFIHSKGLWITGGFIIGFDSDKEDIFEKQVEFITTAAIPWAMIGFLQAPPTTPLLERMLLEGRLFLDSQATSNFSLPNFQTKLPLLVLLKGFRQTLTTLFDAEAYYDRGFRSLWHWKARRWQKPPQFSSLEKAVILIRSIWRQGIRSSYRREYWMFLGKLLRRWGSHPQKLWLGFTILISGHHFFGYAGQVVAELDEEIRNIEVAEQELDTGERITRHS